MQVIKNIKVDLKAKYGIYLKIGLILSLSLIIASFKFFPLMGEIEKFTPPIQNVITIEDVINTVQKRRPPPPPKQPEPISKQDDVPEEPTYENNEIDQTEIIPPPPPPKDRPDMEKENAPFLWVEIMPELIGGISSIKEKIRYTAIGIKAGIEGTVLIEVTINENGTPVDAVILRGIGGGLDEEALEAVLITKFKPGIQGGKPVKVKMVIPIKFKLR